MPYLINLNAEKEMLDKDIIGFASILITLGSSGPYIVRTLKGKIQPHIFTWFIWSLTTGIAAAARSVAHAGPGAWAQWTSTATCFAVALIALKKGHPNIARSDVVTFLGALSAIPAWLITQDPLIATIIVTCIDLTGYYPTFRKAYARPHQEAILAYLISNLSHLLSLSATVDYSATTIMFPAALFTANTCLAGFVWYRRNRMPA